MRHGAPAWYDAVNAGKEIVTWDQVRRAHRSLRSSATAPTSSSTASGPACSSGWGSAFPRRAVVCAITGFGDEGRHARRAGHDLNYMGWAGALADTAPGIPPVQAADLAAGALGAIVDILAALLEREPDRSRAAHHHLDDARSAQAGRAPARRRRRRAPAADGRCSLLFDLPDGRRPLSHGRRAGAEVLAAVVPAPRAGRPGRTPVRTRSGRGPGCGDRHALARRVAGALRRRGCLRRPGLDASRRLRPSSARSMALRQAEALLAASA